MFLFRYVGVRKVAKKAVNVNLEEEVWKEFQKQSIDLGLSSSERVEQMMLNELKKGGPHAEPVPTTP